ncbi:MAG: carboxypeptidase regulatory-like domain-containing protein [Rhodospirillales bacterium]|nr:carboxypeptidase regulatory-like domain-containing protein [Rhodospirillales bacterium]
MAKWSFLLNRYIVTFGSILIVILVWNVIVVLNDDGIIRGRVVGPNGTPVEGAIVILSERSLLVTTARDQVTTMEDGSFEFRNHKFYRVWLEAAKDGVGKYPQTEYRMYFRGQNMNVEEPLILSSGNQG